MKRVIVVSTVGMVLAGSLASASAQSLADVARQEQERRKAIKQPARVYTDADAQKATPLTTAAARQTKEDATGQTAEGSGAVSGDAHQNAAAKPTSNKGATDATEGEDAWRAKAQEARDGLSRSRRLLEAVEQQAMRAAISSANAVAAGQRAPADSGQQERARELDRLRADVERYQAAVASLAEEARRAGVPPGWVR